MKKRRFPPESCPEGFEFTYDDHGTHCGTFDDFGRYFILGKTSLQRCADACTEITSCFAFNWKYNGVGLCTLHEFCDVQFIGPAISCKKTHDAPDVWCKAFQDNRVCSSLIRREIFVQDSESSCHEKCLGEMSLQTWDRACCEWQPHSGWCIVNPKGDIVESHYGGQASMCSRGALYESPESGIDTVTCTDFGNKSVCILGSQRATYVARSEANCQSICAEQLELTSLNTLCCEWQADTHRCVLNPDGVIAFTESEDWTGVMLMSCAMIMEVDTPTLLPSPQPVVAITAIPSRIPSLIPSDLDCDPNFVDRNGIPCNIYSEFDYCTTEGTYGKSWPQGYFADYADANGRTALVCPQCGCIDTETPTPTLVPTLRPSVPTHSPSKHPSASAVGETHDVYSGLFDPQHLVPMFIPAIAVAISTGTGHPFLSIFTNLQIYCLIWVNHLLLHGDYFADKDNSGFWPRLFDVIKVSTGMANIEWTRFRIHKQLLLVLLSLFMALATSIFMKQLAEWYFSSHGYEGYDSSKPLYWRCAAYFHEASGKRLSNEVACAIHTFYRIPVTVLIMEHLLQNNKTFGDWFFSAPLLIFPVWFIFDYFVLYDGKLIKQSLTSVAVEARLYGSTNYGELQHQSSFHGLCWETSRTLIQTVQAVLLVFAREKGNRKSLYVVTILGFSHESRDGVG